MDEARLEHLRRLYTAIAALNSADCGPRKLSESTAALGWPQRGVYFFMEAGERRSDTGDGPRIVRVGTHALKSGARTTLWKRLSQHKGQGNAGGGNHRCSIFRLIVGTALIEKNGYKYPTWDNRTPFAQADVRVAETPLECEVSKVIGEMSFVWLPVSDEPGPASKRGYIERNTIALLSNFEKASIDPPSSSWLGHFCSRPHVKRSGLWNRNHVDEEYDPAFLDELDRLVLAADGNL
jgi:hypothetical protein